MSFFRKKKEGGAVGEKVEAPADTTVDKGDFSSPSKAEPASASTEAAAPAAASSGDSGAAEAKPAAATVEKSEAAKPETKADAKSEDAKSPDGKSGGAASSAPSPPPPSASARLDIETQMCGNLYKKDTQGSNTWQERLFVLKDGFLLYFAPGKTAVVPPYDQLIHPKGCFPMDSVEIETTRAGPSKATQSAIRISHSSFGMRSLLVCAKDDAERDRWMAALTAARAVTFNSTVSQGAQVESLARRADEAESKAHKMQAQLFRRTLQVNRLVAQNKALLAAIAAAEAATGYKIDISEAEAAAAAVEASAAHADLDDLGSTVSGGSTAGSRTGSMSAGHPLGPAATAAAAAAAPAAVVSATAAALGGYFGAPAAAPAAVPLPAARLPPPPSLPTVLEAEAEDAAAAASAAAAAAAPPPYPYGAADSRGSRTNSIDTEFKVSLPPPYSAPVVPASLPVPIVAPPPPFPGAAPAAPAPVAVPAPMRPGGLAPPMRPAGPAPPGVAPVAPAAPAAAPAAPASADEAAAALKPPPRPARKHMDAFGQVKPQ